MGKPRGDAFKDHDVHGIGVKDIRRGFDEIGMPTRRHPLAEKIVNEVMAANGATTLYWYVTNSRKEVNCYWDDAEVNTLWIAPNNVHILESTTPPGRSLTWSRSSDGAVGWKLEGAT